MRMRNKILAGSAALTAAISLGLVGGTAQARVVGPQPAVHHLTATPSIVPAGIVTGVNVTDPCPNKVTPKSVVGLPPPDGAKTNIQVFVYFAEKNDDPATIIFIGVWPAAGSPFNITITCPGGQVGKVTITVEAAPAPKDVVGVGSDTIQNVMDAFSNDYNSSPPKGSKGNLWSWDATNPITAVMNDPINMKPTCTGTGGPIATIPRPDGSSAGILALTTENGTVTGGQETNQPCLDFARSSRARATGDPTSITFDAIAGDAVTYATASTTNAPGNLTTAQLTAIYNCTDTNWSQVGGSNAPINAFLPQSGSGTRSFFLSAIGLAAPGSCVSTSATQFGAAGANDNTLQENEGVAASLRGHCTNGSCPTADEIFPFSVGKYIAERYHSAKCLDPTGACAPNSMGFVCAPSGSNNLFGCNTHGTLNLNMVNGTNPTVPFPLTNATTNAKINSGFTPGFQRLLYVVLLSPEFAIPPYLVPYFGPKGWVCTNKDAHEDLLDYGFLPLTVGTAAGDCGSLS